MKRRNVIIAILFGVATFFLFLDFGEQKETRSFKDLFGKKEAVGYQRIEGEIFGTFYHIIYDDPQQRDLQPELLEVLGAFNHSLSTYDPNSTISKINQSQDSAMLDDYMKEVYVNAQLISENSNGAFDMTVAPLVNYWGFGFDARDVQQKKYAAAQIDSIKTFVGFSKTKIKGNTIIKDDPRIQLDASAIAKGYGVDVAASFLASKGCKNYMVEIGGEVVTLGKNPKGLDWRIGINKPIDSPVAIDNSLQAKVSLSGKAMASSGNYRQFYMLDGKKYSHTINPITGYPVSHNLLASSVIADRCLTADGYATACMVLGVEKSLEMAKRTPEIEAYLIYEDENKEIKTVYSDGFASYLID